METEMFTFVIWIVGLAIIATLGIGNVLLVGTAFSKHWLAGMLTLGASIIAWLTVLIICI